MVKHYSLMESLSTNLHDFLKKVTQNLSLPDTRFLRDGLIGLIPAVCQNGIVSKVDCTIGGQASTENGTTSEGL